MRILKYIFLLLVLILIGVAVFVATQKGDFDITQSRVIKSPKNVVFNYVSDYNNWQDWFLADDTKFIYPGLNTGKGSSFSWTGSESDGSIRTVAIKDNESISQQMEWNGLPAEVFWTFKDTAGKTKVTWHVKGKMGFMPKIYAVMKGGAEKIMGTIFENSLAKLDKTLDYELNTYKINVDGVVNMPGTFYLKQSITSTIANTPRNMRIMMSKLLYFFKKNDIPMAGKPFVIYHSYDNPKEITRFSVCVPIHQEIYTAPGSDITHGKTDTIRAVKATLIGDYSHLREAWKKTSDYISQNNFRPLEGKEYIEMYIIGREQTKSPSKWNTEIYLPIAGEVAAPKPVAAVPITPAVRPPAEDSGAEEISIP